jgi:hypothetical protein
MPKTTPRGLTAAASSLVLSIFLTAALVFPATGSAAEPLPLVVTPSPASFTATTVGEKSFLEVDIFNEGEEASIEKIAIEGAEPGEFGTGSNNCPGTLGEGQHCQVTINFEPHSSGEKNATAFIRFSGGERGEESFELNGTGAAPHLSFSPPEIDFGLQPVNSGSTSRTLTVENDGEAPTRINGVGFEGSSNSFGFDSNTCQNRLLQPAETCSIQAFFFPNNVEPYATALRVDVVGQSFTVPLSGEGVRQEVEASPNPLDFGVKTAGSSGVVRTLSVTNTGRIPALFFIAVISGGDAGSFHLVDESCTGVILQPGEGCSAEVRFAPLSAGSKAATLAMFGNNEGPIQVSLLGEGIPASVSLAPSSFGFGRQALGSKSVSHSFAVRNDGSGPFELGAASLVGSDLDQFRLSGDTCTGATLAAGQQCQLRVRFAPDSRGSKSAVLRLTSPAGPLTASLSGTGVKAPLSRVSFRWRSVGGKLHGSTALRVGSAKCLGAKHCVVTVTSRLGGVKLPKTRVRIGANKSKPLDVRVPKAVRKRLDMGRSTLSLKAKWTVAGKTGESHYRAIVR